MAKFYGIIGYGTTVDQGNDVWLDEIVEHHCIGDVVNYTRRYENANQVNDNVGINASFSIVASPFAMDNLHNMRYIEWMGVKWKITSVDPTGYPRLVLTVGGVWNEG